MAQYFTLERFRGESVFNAEVELVAPIEDFVAIKLVGWDCPIAIGYEDLPQALSDAPTEEI